MLPAAPPHRTTTSHGPKKFLNSRRNEIVWSHVHLLAELMLAWITPDFAISLKKPLTHSTIVIDFPQLSLLPTSHLPPSGFYSSRPKIPLAGIAHSVALFS
jgi:hypothetical protein